MRLPVPLLRKRSCFRWCRLFVGLFIFAASVSAADTSKKSFDVPAGVAGETLKRFAAQAEREIVFSAKSVGQTQTNAIKGIYTTQEALDLLLQDTGLVSRQDQQTGAISVRKQTSALPKATASAIQEAAVAAERETPAEPAWDTTIRDVDGVATLSPFEVSTDRDVGYTASNSLAGGRLNTDLRDTAAAISVFTKEFLDDIGVTSVNEAIEYGLNTATEYDPTGNNHLGNNFNYRIRGISGAQRSRNLFRTQLNLDSYNTERLDFSRGPNAILFGEGSPAGLINTSTKAARLNSNFGRSSVRFGSFEEQRFTFDINRRLGRTFAVRANVLWQKANGYREFEFDNRKAAAIAATWRPFRKTTLKVDIERAEFDANRARPWTPVDRYSIWDAAGRPGSGTPTTWGVATPNTNGFFSQQVFYFHEGVLAGFPLWISGGQQLRASAGPPTVPGINTSVNILDESLIPRNANPTGAGARSESHFTVGGVSLEQQIGEDLFIELAMNGEYEERLWANPVGFADIGYRLDANLYLPVFTSAGLYSGATALNPYFGKPFIYGQVFNRNNKFYREQSRATASYSLDFKKLFPQRQKLAGLLGRHRFAAMASTESFDRETRDEREVNISPNRVQQDMLNTQNAILRISYVDYLSANPIERGHRDPSLYPITPGLLVNNVSRSVESGIVNTAWTWQKTELDTKMFAMQNFFLNDRLVTTFGWRKDELKVFSSTQVRGGGNQVTGFVRGTKADRVIPGDTFTRGAVAHILSWGSVYYNESDNFTSQDAVQKFGILGQEDIIGNRTGVGKDAGVKLSFFRGKINAQIGWYETSDADQVSSVNGVFGAWTRAIWDALGRPVEIDGRDTRSLKSEGYEFELTANPTRRIRFSLSAKKAETTVDKLLTIVQAYVDRNRAEWTANSSAPINTSVYTTARPTVGEVITQIEQQLVIERAPQGQAPYQDREITANFFGTYKFDSGRLNGLMFGGGVQYRGPALITYRVATTGAPVYADAYTMATGMLAYEKKLSKKVDLRVQLNVDNLFNFLDPQPVQGGEPVQPTTIPTKDGIAYLVSLPVPRRYAITFSLGF